MEPRASHTGEKTNPRCSQTSSEAETTELSRSTHLRLPLRPGARQRFLKQKALGTRGSRCVGRACLRTHQGRGHAGKRAPPPTTRAVCTGRVHPSPHRGVCVHRPGAGPRGSGRTERPPSALACPQGAPRPGADSAPSLCPVFILRDLPLTARHQLGSRLLPSDAHQLTYAGDSRAGSPPKEQQGNRNREGRGRYSPRGCIFEGRARRGC